MSPSGITVLLFAVASLTAMSVGTAKAIVVVVED
jgi:hypothetical protein